MVMRGLTITIRARKIELSGYERTYDNDSREENRVEWL
jgi:hypothetical protein